MTFEEMQLILQSIVVSQREADAILRETAAKEALEELESGDSRML